MSTKINLSKFAITKITNSITNEVISYYGYLTKYSEELSNECRLCGYKVFANETEMFIGFKW